MILVPALVMGVLLAGAMFYVAAVGNAIIFRTELQNAADVTAFQSAVWHARGMNVIACLNILMSLALAVFALVRIAEIVLFLVGLIPIIGSPFMSAANFLLQQEMNIHKFVNPVLKVLQGSQEAVSVAVPYLAFADAKRTKTSANTVWPISMSLLPTQVDKALGQEMRRPHNFPAALPIQEDEFGVLCGKAAFFLPKQVTNFIERAHLPGASAFKRIADTIMDDVGVHLLKQGDGIFCQPLVGGLTSIASKLLDEACDSVREMDDEEEDAAAAKEEQARKQQAKPGDEPEDPKEAAKRKKERSGKRADGKKREPIDCGDGVDQKAKGANAGIFDVKPAKMWEASSNGSLFMHNWSWAQGEPKLFARNQQGIGLADKGRLGNVTPSDTATAMAEFYFDCDDEWGHKCEPDAAWTPNWTARMRRFRSPGDELKRMPLDFGYELLETLQQSIGAHATDVVGDVMNKLTGLPPDNALARWFGEQIDKIPLVKEISEKIDSVVGGAREATGIDKYLDPGRYTNPDRIH